MVKEKAIIMGYVLTISIILHFITFYILIILYQRQKNIEPVDKEKILREMEDLLIAYTTEMKENNEQLAKTILREKKATPLLSTNIVRPLTEKVEVETTMHQNTYEHKDDEQPTLLAQEEKHSSDFSEENEYSNYVPPIPEDDVPPVETSPISQILSLHKRGLTVNEIAKQLNMGAGEVELLIKIHQ